MINNTESAGSCDKHNEMVKPVGVINIHVNNIVAEVFFKSKNRPLAMNLPVIAPRARVRGALSKGERPWTQLFFWDCDIQNVYSRPRDILHANTARFQVCSLLNGQGVDSTNFPQIQLILLKKPVSIFFDFTLIR